jgi:gamma-glutamylcyclotransferase (GGCT)/AIG2-like uncharacterized protein YtfP
MKPSQRGGNKDGFMYGGLLSGETRQGQRHTMKKTDILFVYGTLQRGRPANILMRLKQAEFLDIATLDGYALYNLGHYPGIVSDEKESVLGEAFRVMTPRLRPLTAMRMKAACSAGAWLISP